MKQSEHKEVIVKDLEAMGFKLKHNQYSKRVGMFHVIIFLSKQTRVLIETSGQYGSHYIILDETRESYSDTSANKLVKIFNRYINKCEAFTKAK